MSRVRRSPRASTSEDRSEPRTRSRVTQVRKGRASAESAGRVLEDVSSDESGAASDSSPSDSYLLNGQPLDLNATAAALMAQHEEDRMSPAMEHTFDLLIWSIPFSALFVLLDIMIQQQYAMHPTFMIEAGRMLGTLPFLIALIWFSTIKPILPRRILQPLFFLASLACGCAFIWTFHEAPFLEVIRRTPPLGCLWVYCIVKMDLVPCVVSLAGVGGFIWYQDLPLFSDRL
ncbi:unnamed protein product [Parajaminaea phylloscopi]